MTIRVLVCGGRDFNDRDYIWDTLCRLDSEHGPFGVIIHGCATGADSESEIWADAMSLKACGFRAEWDKHGKAAGPIRNKRMLKEGRPDLVVAFPGGRGTANMVRQAKASGVRVIEIVRPETP